MSASVCLCGGDDWRDVSSRWYSPAQCDADIEPHIVKIIASCVKKLGFVSAALLETILQRLVPSNKVRAVGGDPDAALLCPALPSSLEYHWLVFAFAGHELLPHGAAHRSSTAGPAAARHCRGKLVTDCACYPRSSSGDSLSPSCVPPPSLLALLTCGASWRRGDNSCSARARRWRTASSPSDARSTTCCTSCTLSARRCCSTSCPRCVET